MKTLKQTILEGLFKNVGIGSEALKQEIENWIKKNASATNLKIEIIDGNKFIANADEVEYKIRANSLTNGKFTWGEVGEFDCRHTNITSLEGSPTKCEKFICLYCERLTSLMGLPQECEEIDCSYCENLISLEGSPKKCVSFDCHGCEKLKTLEGAPQECERFWCCQCHGLTSFKGGPEKCIEMFNGEACSGIKDFKGAPKVCDDFYCPWCTNLISLEGAPKGCSKFNCRNSKKQFTEREIVKYLK